MPEEYCSLTNKDCDRDFNCGKNPPLYRGSCVHAVSALINYAESQGFSLSQTTSSNQWKVVGYAEKIIGNRSQVAFAEVCKGNLVPLKLREKTIKTLIRG